MIGAVRFGFEDSTAEYYNHWKKCIDEKYTYEGGLDRTKATEWHRAALTAVCLGADPTDVSGIDLLTDGVYSRGEDLGRQGLNGWVWALIAIDSCDWKVPESAELSRTDIVRHILESQNGDGGFSIEESAGRSDPDLTAMVLQALAPYRGSEEVSAAAERALDYLAGNRGNTCETLSQIVCALCCLGKDPDEDSRFEGLTDDLIAYANDDGGFSHEKDSGSSEMASAQALIALCSLERLRNGERGVFDMNSGPPAAPTACTLEEAAAAKEVNLTMPRENVMPSPIKHESKATKTALVVSILVCSVGAVAAGIILRRRKENKE